MATVTDTAARDRWEQDNAAAPTREQPPTTVSSVPIDALYTPDSLPGFDPEADLGYPGQYPYTRGVHASMYRSRLWTMRQFAGFGTPRQTNERFRFLLDKGQTGLSTAFDLPTLMGLDGDDPRALGEVGRLGVAVSTLDDMRELFDGIDLGRVSVSMTINAPAIVVMAFYLANAQDQGVDWKELRGTLQNDILKEFHAQNEFVFPPEPHVRLVCDVIEFGTHHVPQWNTVSISGYHIREAGSTALQEMAFTLANAKAYLRAAQAAGLDVDTVAPRISFFWNAHNDFFEEVAKFRAARTLWAQIVRDEFGSRDPKSQMLRFHTQTGGSTLTAQEPENNVVRVTLQAFAAVLGGTQSLHTNSLDEVLALPTEKNVQIALRTQQVLAYETGVTNVIDPLGGSYFVEALTTELEDAAEDYFRRIDELGGVIPAIHAGFFQKEIADASYRYQREIENGERIIVGVNEFIVEEEQQIALLKIDRDMELEQCRRVQAFRASRDAAEVESALAAFTRAAETDENLMPHYLDCVRKKATLGEISEALVPVFGRYREPAFI